MTICLHHFEFTPSANLQVRCGVCHNLIEGTGHYSCALCDTLACARCSVEGAIEEMIVEELDAIEVESCDIIKIE